MNQKTFIVALALIFSLTQSKTFAQEGSAFRFSFGLGYDNISEKYYLVHYDTISVPSESLEALRRATEEIEEQKVLLELDLNKSLADHSRFLIQNRFSLSSLYVRDILRLEWQTDWLTLADEAELRTIRDKDKVTYQSDFLTNSLDVKLRASPSPGTSLTLRNNLEYTEYKDKSPYVYDYYLNRTTLELDRDVSEDGFFRLSYQLSKRNVPDSASINYAGHFVDLSFDKYFGWETLLQVENELERKTFNKPQGQDDFWQNRFTLALDRKIRERTKLLFRNEFEVLGYDAEDEINFGYLENQFSGLVQFELQDGLVIAGGPEWTSFFSLRSAYRDYDYRQPSWVASLDLMRTVSFWTSLEDKFGKRDYRSDDNPFYTDYLFNQLTLFLTADLNPHMGFNLMLSVDSEWHDSRQDDLTVFLISSELTYRF